jgi:hypothetical protein
VIFQGENDLVVDTQSMMSLSEDIVSPAPPSTTAGCSTSARTIPSTLNYKNTIEFIERTLLGPEARDTAAITQNSKVSRISACPARVSSKPHATTGLTACARKDRRS